MTVAVFRSSPSHAGRGDSFVRRWLESPLALASAVFVASLAWTLIVRLPLFRADSVDDASFVEIAHLWLRGVLPYAGVFDVKPPGLFALISAAEAVFGPRLEALRAVSISSDAVTATALFFLARRFGDMTVGVFAAILYPVLSLIVIGYDAYCPLAALTTLAFLAALSPLSLICRAVLAGLAIGAAGAVKQTAGFEAVALLAILIGAPEGVGRRGWAALAYGLGVGVAPLGFLIYFAWHGAAGALFADTVVAALLRPASATEGISFARGLARFLPLQCGLLPLTGLSLLAMLRGRALKGAAPGLRGRPLSLWLVAALASVIVQRSSCEQYLGAALAPCFASGGVLRGQGSAGACAHSAIGAARLAGVAFGRRRLLRAGRRSRQTPGCSGPRGRRRGDPRQKTSSTSSTAACGSTAWPTSRRRQNTSFHFRRCARSPAPARAASPKSWRRVRAIS